MNKISATDIIKIIGEYLIDNDIEVEIFRFKCVFTMPSNKKEFNIRIYEDRVELSANTALFDPAPVLWSQELTDPEALPNLVALLKTAYA